MSEDATPHPSTTTPVVYHMPGSDAITVLREVQSRAADGGVLAMDIYLPPDTAKGARLPAVVIVAGYPDEGFQKFLGCRFKDMASSQSWARLMALSGMAAITYTNRRPGDDLRALVDHLVHQAPVLGIDERRIGIWASSGNVPLALSLLMRDAPARVRCAALLYGYMLDLDGATAVADAARGVGFANPCAGRTIADLSTDVPLFIARAGQDQFPGLKESIDAFIAGALGRNLPLTFANHPAGPHAFDLFDASDTSREIVRRVLRFLQFHLLEIAHAD
jgi:hypothetical protein